MSNKNAIRAWKDEDFRLSLNETELAQLPANPAGPVELTNEQLGMVAGGVTIRMFTICCSLGCKTHVGCIIPPHL
jgi:mersacidin/lichenicidin family type 2 lantibiotic